MPKKTTSFVPIPTPSHLLAIYDPQIADQRVRLYGWQKQVHQEFSTLPSINSTKVIDVVAANSSGKSKNIIAPCAIWGVTQFDKAEIVATTASGSQLDRQTSRYIKDVASMINSWHKSNLFTIQDRKLVFAPTDGVIDLFATDDPGKAEGWHQRDYDTFFAMLVDEAKTVADEIYTALDRCHDAHLRLHVSSPATRTTGRYYQSVTSPITELHKMFKVTAFDCPHISVETIKSIIRTYGRNSPITKSIIDAEFSSADEQVVIQRQDLLDLLKNKPLMVFKDQPIRVGIDMAAGGDEDVIDIWQGNRQVALIPFREPDTTKAVDYIMHQLTMHKVQKDSEYIFADDGGVGRSMIDMLTRGGWNVKRVLNNSRAANSSLYGNRGAELWFNFATYVINKELIFLGDETQIDQLSARYYKRNNQSIVLESKQVARSKGHPSPDRADACILAFTGLPLAPHFMNLGGEATRQEVAYGRNQISSEEAQMLLAKLLDIQFGFLPLPGDMNKGNPLNGDLSRLFSKNGSGGDILGQGKNDQKVVQNLLGWK